MPKPDAAVAIVQTRGPRECVLLMRRAEREGDSWSGHWSLPGGRCEPEDTDSLHTALRELEEECGIRLARAQMEAALPHTVARRRVGRYLHVAPFLFRVEGELATVLDPREAVEALWVPLAVLRDPARHALGPVPGRPREMLFPSVQLQGAPLWGFTYRLLTDWLGLGPKQRPVEQAGLEAATTVLEFLLSRGLTLRQDWRERRAAVGGAIPVEEVLARFSQPGSHVISISCLEVRKDQIRLAGPSWEEYFISAAE
jgi:8-oxo-dGTP pyrophosphatase MutT (NUDIX family)